MVTSPVGASAAMTFCLRSWILFELEENALFSMLRHSVLQHGAVGYALPRTATVPQHENVSFTRSYLGVGQNTTLLVGTLVSILSTFLKGILDGKGLVCCRILHYTRLYIASKCSMPTFSPLHEPIVWSSRCHNAHKTSPSCIHRENFMNPSWGCHDVSMSPSWRQYGF